MWTRKQRITQFRACAGANIDDDNRKLILRQLPNAMYDRDGKPAKAPSCTSKKLDNRDYEQFMAIIEGYSGGQIKTAKGDPDGAWPKGYWGKKAENYLQRMRHKAFGLAATLERAGHLDANGVGLRGWIDKRVTRGQTDRVDELDWGQLHALINGLRNYARRHGIKAD